ncbi:MAG: hypothetical protein Q4F66_04385 [Clostridium sp.]|nr:hypothetical protein [Clostridium sp.]
MNKSSSIDNIARIIYEYSVNPDELQNTKCKCCCTKSGINVSEPIEVSIDMNGSVQCYEVYINIKNITVYPLSIWINIKLPDYAVYNNLSFVRDGWKLGCVDLYYDFCVGILKPQQSSTVSFCGFIKPGYNESQICMDTITYYNMIIPYKPSPKWYCIKSDECFNLIN